MMLRAGKRGSGLVRTATCCRGITAPITAPGGIVVAGRTVGGGAGRLVAGAADGPVAATDDVSLVRTPKTTDAPATTSIATSAAVSSGSRNLRGTRGA